MAQLLYPLALLACPVGMGLMMLMMMRGGKSTDTAAQDPARTSADELTRLRAEVDQLRAEQRGNNASSSTYSTGAGPVDRG
ncbi:hypothetical protein GCM10027596_39830 [Nocardioides korecus]